MNRYEIEQKFTTSERLVIKRFLTLINDETSKNSGFADASDIDALNEFSDFSESDEQITQSVKDWLKKKKTFLRGNTTNN
jgi:predicted RecB family nuclease